MIYHLLLGSNLDDPAGRIAEAIQRLVAIPEINILRQSSLVQTKAYGKIDQPDFWNQILEIECGLSPERLLDILQETETGMGRIRTEKWGPRRIDIDILLAEDYTCQTDRLTIPHYDLHNREFALRLLCELIPDWVHPILNKTTRELLRSLPGGNT